MRQDSDEVIERVGGFLSHSGVDLESWLKTIDSACSENLSFTDLVRLFKRLEVPISQLESRLLFTQLADGDRMPIKTFLNKFKVSKKAKSETIVAPAPKSDRS